MTDKIRIKTSLIIGLAFIAAMIAATTPAQAYTNLAITDDNLDTLDSFTYSGAWYNVGTDAYVLDWYGGGEYFEEPWKDPAWYQGLVTATIMADYEGNHWGECVSMVKNLAHSTVVTGSWYRGGHVMDGGISPGTTIARFVWSSEQQRYIYVSDGTCHAAIFREYTYDQNGNRNGIIVWDQNWWTNENDEGIVMMHKISNAGSGLSDADNYYVIQV
ncbi:MAG: BPSL0067 family protein [Patescibacteria group bacterium]